MRRFLLPLLFLSLGFSTSDLAAQELARVSVERENFRKTPGAGGTILASVNRGTELPVLESQGRWRRVWLKGYVWAPSVATTDREGADLVVSRDGGENLRDVPNGRIAARMREGMLLDRVGQVGNWYQVEREGWIWAPSITLQEGDESDRGTAGGQGGGGAAEGTPDPSGEAAAVAGTSAAPPEGQTGPAAAMERMVVDDDRTVLRLTPDGDTVARAFPGAHVEVVDREGEWVRVRVDGWVRSPGLASPDSAAVSEDLTVQALRADPERYRGRRVRWTVRFISLERAEQGRTDFREDEPFILARPTDSGEGFVYLTVPPDMLSRVEEIEPLQSIEVVARVRTGRSALMGVPVLELLALYR